MKKTEFRKLVDSILVDSILKQASSLGYNQSNSFFSVN